MARPLPAPMSRTTNSTQPRADAPCASAAEPLAVPTARPAITSPGRRHPQGRRSNPRPHCNPGPSRHPEPPPRNRPARRLSQSRHRTPRCPVCVEPLVCCSSGHACAFPSRFNDITTQHTHGYCKRCANGARLLTPPCAWTTPPVIHPPSKLWWQWLPAKCLSPWPASCWNALPALNCPRRPLDRQANPRVQRAQQLRPSLSEPAATYLCQPEPALDPIQTIIQPDAGCLREPDARGQRARLRRQGIEPERWPGFTPARSSA